MQNEDGSFPQNRRRPQKTLNVSNCLFALSENVQIELPKTWLQILRRTHASAKELQKKVAGNCLAVQCRTTI